MGLCRSGIMHNVGCIHQILGNPHGIVFCSKSVFGDICTPDGCDEIEVKSNDGVYKPIR